MILFGRRVHHLGLQELSEESCIQCGEGKVVVSLFQQYFHVLWLPIFPVKKRAAAQCLSCRSVTKEVDFTLHQKEVSQYLKSKHSTPLWAYTGLVITFALLLIKFI